MIWKDYSNLRGSHAFLSPSRYHWINYTEEKLRSVYENQQKIVLGTKYHAFAANAIELAVRLPNNGATINSFVNDAIGFRMTPEVVLYYSPNCYGTADAVGFNNGVLRVHDLKTGTTPASIMQLVVYSALFCLDYPDNKPDIVNLRIYQNDEIVEYEPHYNEIFDVMERIREWDRIIEEINESAIF